MATDTKLKPLIINYLTQEEYNALETKDENQIYLTPNTAISTVSHDNTLEGNGTVDDPLKVVGLAWGGITGTLSDQTDLSEELQNIREVAAGRTKTYVVSYVQNPNFNTQADSFSLIGEFTDITGKEYNVTDLALGDVIYVQEVDVPDRWCSQVQDGVVTLYKLETSKVQIPTKVSELENDENYIKSIVTDDSLSGNGTAESPLSVASPRIIFRKW